ncbi:MAG: bacteriohemerythrin [Sedimenticola sp.]
MPGFMRFNKRMALDIAELDEEHLMLVETLNRLAETLKTPSPEATLAALVILEELSDETSVHFRNEERFMERAGFSELQEHQREHALLRAELHQFIREIENGDEQLDMESMRQLKQWLIGHIVGSDREFANFYNRQKRS